MNYASRVLCRIKEKYADQPEFVQAVTEVLQTLEPIINRNE